MIGLMFRALKLALVIAFCVSAFIIGLVVGCNQTPVCSPATPCPYGPLPPWGPNDRPLYLANDAGAHDGADAR